MFANQPNYSNVESLFLMLETAVEKTISPQGSMLDSDKSYSRGKDLGPSEPAICKLESKLTEQSPS